MLLSTSLLSLNGCVWLLAGAAGGASAYGYVRGAYTSAEDATINETWNATVNALKELKIPIQSKNKDGLIAVVNAVTADDKNVKITLSRVSSDTTSIKIRIGVFGDKMRTRQLLDTIREHLGVE